MKLRARLGWRWRLAGLLMLAAILIVGYASPLRDRQSRASAVDVRYASHLRDRQPVAYSVDGQLLVADKPAGNAALALHPLDGTAASISRPVAMSGADGSFRFTTYTSGDGAPAGEYVVTVIWPDPTSPVDECACEDPTEHDLLCGQYADPLTSPLRATVFAHDNRLVLTALPCDERRRFERWLRRQAGGSVLQKLQENVEDRSNPLKPQSGAGS